MRIFLLCSTIIGAVIIFICFAIISLSIHYWGTSFAEGILISVLVTVIAGILLGSRFASSIEPSPQNIPIDQFQEVYQFAEFGRVATGVFHDLSTPLTVINLSLSNPDNQKTDKTLNGKAVNEIKFAAAQMQEYLVSARKQIQKQDIEQAFNLNTEIIDLIKLHQYRARQEQVKIIPIIHQRIKLVGNPLKYYQIISNLVSNSIDAYSESPHKKRVVLIKIIKNQKHVSITVKDFGHGIAPENLQRIFEPLFTTKLTHTGTGLGLSMVKTIVEQDLGGRIKVQSRVGKGTAVKLTIPIKVVS